MFPASTHNFFKKWKISTFSELASWLTLTLFMTKLCDIPYHIYSLLYGTRTMLVLNLPAFENKKKYTAYDRFHGNGPYGEIPTEKEPIGTLGFVLPYNNVTQSWRGILKLLLKRISFPWWTPKAVTKLKGFHVSEPVSTKLKTFC